MGIVLAGMSMSLDGFIEDRNGSVARLYPDLDALRQTDLLQEAIQTTGAVVMGRRAYDMAEGDFSGYEFQVPIFVLTHATPEQVAKGENERLRFTFISLGNDRHIGSFLSRLLHPRYNEHPDGLDLAKGARSMHVTLLASIIRMRRCLQDWWKEISCPSDVSDPTREMLHA